MSELREVIIGDRLQYKLKEDGTFYSRVIKKGRGGSILGDDWIKKDPTFGRCDYRGGGYYVVSLTFEGKTYHRLHRLVARFFVEGYGKDLSVNHIDGNRANNNASNLEWVTHSENMKNAKDRGALKGRNNLKGRLDEFNLLTIITLINSGFKNGDIADHYKLDKSNISKIRNKDGKTFGQFQELVINPLTKSSRAYNRHEWIKEA